MGVGSNKSGGAGVVVSCVVLGLALLVVGAAAAKSSPNSCKALCRGREDYKPCHAACLWGVHLGSHGRTQGETAVGGIGAPPTCRVRCRHADDIAACVKQCQSGIQGEEAREGAVEASVGGGGSGLLVMPTERAGRKGGEKKKQADAAPVQLKYDPEICSFVCRYIHEKEDCLRRCEAAPNEARG
uniref:Acidic protein n=1 Tax=Triticum urartu TaxID=4572 RepID=A0A8R7QP70_TRIUA